MRKDKSWLIISVLVILMALIWLGISAFQTLRKTTVPADVAVVIKPLNPQINQEIIPLLDKRSIK
jgi:uncharacterized protein YoxC